MTPHRRMACKSLSSARVLGITKAASLSDILHEEEQQMQELVQLPQLNCAQCAAGCSEPVRRHISASAMVSLPSTPAALQSGFSIGVVNRGSDSG